MKFYFTLIFTFFISVLHSQKTTIYHTSWIDFNKNGKMDVYEDPSKPIDKRIDDLLSQMTLEEKTCQMATLYGYGRVLKDEMPISNPRNSARPRRRPIAE